MASARGTSVKQNNKQRILEATIRLMNEQGGAVGTSQIAEYLGISPGNLYYHFRNREEILRELFERLVRELDEVLRVEPGEPISVTRLVACFTGGTRVLWRYRFFFASAVDFIGRDPWLAQRFLDFSRRSQQYMRLIIQSAMKGAPGAVTASARQIAHLAETMWVLWVSWPRYSELSQPGRKLGEADIGHGLEQIAFVLAPYLSEAYYKLVMQRLHRFVKALERDTDA